QLCQLAALQHRQDLTRLDRITKLLADLDDHSLDSWYHMGHPPRVELDLAGERQDCLEDGRACRFDLDAGLLGRLRGEIDLEPVLGQALAMKSLSPFLSFFMSCMGLKACALNTLSRGVTHAQYQRGENESREDHQGNCSAFLPFILAPPSFGRPQPAPRSDALPRPPPGDSLRAPADIALWLQTRCVGRPGR